LGPRGGGAEGPAGILPSKKMGQGGRCVSRVSDARWFDCDDPREGAPLGEGRKGWVKGKRCEGWWPGLTGLPVGAMDEWGPPAARGAGRGHAAWGSRCRSAATRSKAAAIWAAASGEEDRSPTSTFPSYTSQTRQVQSQSRTRRAAR